MRGRKRILDDLDEDIHHHIEEETQDNIERGMSPQEARYAALRKFGNVTRVKEQTREVWSVVWLDSLAQDIRFALRMLRKSSGFTIVAVLTLALGIGANTAIFSVVNTLFLHPPGVAHPGQVVVQRVRCAKVGLKNTDVSPPDFAQMRDSKKIFASSALEHVENASYTSGEYPLLLGGAKVSWQWFDVFGASPILGRVFTPEEDQPNGDHEVVLSYYMWRRWFGGDAGVIGRTIQLSHQPYRMIGVMGRDFLWPNTAKFWLPLALPPSAFDVSNTFNFNDQYLAVARLQPGVTFAQASSYMDVLSKRFADPRAKANAEASQWSMFLMTFPEFVFGDLRKPLIILGAAVAFVLLIACANIAGLLLAKAAGRSKELAVRTALGASRARLIAQALVENLILGVLGVIAGLVLAVWGLQALLFAAPRDLPADIVSTLDAYVLGFTALVGVLAVLISGVAPAWRMSKVNSQSALHEGSRSVTGSRARQNFRSWLVAGELALGLVLLAGTGVLLRSLARIGGANPGFNPHGVMAVGLVLPDQQYETQDKQYAFFRDVLGRLARMQGITVVGAGDPIPFLGENPSENFQIEGQPVPPGDPGPNGNIRIVTGGYFAAFGIPLRRGRLFTDDDSAGSQPVAIIDENLVREYWPNEDPIGKRIRRGSKSPWTTIVGIVGHIRFNQLAGEESSGREGESSGVSLQSASKGAYYLPMYQDRAAYGFLIAKSSAGVASAEVAIRQAVHAVDPNLPFFANSMDARIAESLGPQRFATKLVTVFAALAILLAAVGLYGLISYNVTQRVNELGIRMALGALPADVLQLVLRQGVKLAIVGAGSGALVGIALMGAMQSVLYGVSSADPVSFIAAAVLLMLIALATCYIPARRAMRVDPMVALRSE